MLIDATTAGVDELGLRGLARAATEASGAAYVSRAYRFPYALVAWHSAHVGVDIERAIDLDASVAKVICTPAELATYSHGGAELSTLWSAKEALAKALGDALLYDPCRLTSPVNWPPVVLEEAISPQLRMAGQPRGAGRWRAVAIEVPAGYFGWLCWPTTAPARRAQQPRQCIVEGGVEARGLT